MVRVGQQHGEHGERTGEEHACRAKDCQDQTGCSFVAGADGRGTCVAGHARRWLVSVAAEVGSWTGRGRGCILRAGPLRRRWTGFL